MNKIINRATLILLLSFSSCDCYQNVSGKVIDFETKKPIDSVCVQKVNRKHCNYSDSEGNFKLQAISGGLFGCPPMKIILNKDGYKQKVENINNGSSKIIYLSRK